VRLIVHRAGDSILVCYVNHHDAAYGWAERRKLEVHPTTGAAQLVVVRETVVEVPRCVVTTHADTLAPAPKQRVLIVSREELLGYGVPTEWVEEVLAATEDSILDVAKELPAEAAEAVLILATGGTPIASLAFPSDADPFEHPDAQRRFRVVQDREEPEQGVAASWEKWTIFLHPAQRAIVQREYAPARVPGTAGTGKTVVALHRAVHLARTDKSSRVLVATFSVTLARMLRQKLGHLIGNDGDLATRMVVDTVDEAARRLYEASFGQPRMVTEGMLRSLLREEAAAVGAATFSERFVYDEWISVVDAWQLTTWESYRDVPRLGRKTRLGEKRREVLWKVFARARSRIEEGALVTQSMIFEAVTRELGEEDSRFAHVTVDEVQDVSVPQLRFLAVAGGRPDGLFFAGDVGQRIFQIPFRGRRSESMCAVGRMRYGSTTAHRTRFAVRPTVSSRRNSQTWTEISSRGAGWFLCSTAQRPR